MTRAPDTIKLDQFLKYMNVTGSGGQAKVLIQYGGVEVNGEVETRRGRQLKSGDRVTVNDQHFVVDLEATDGVIGRPLTAERAVDPADNVDGPQSSSGWESAECVARFAERDADHRLQRLVDDYPDPAATPVLDLGCAAGRNTAFLCERGFDVIAVDTSSAMIEYTRARVASLLGEQEATRRVRYGRMDELGWAADGSFVLIVALGIYHEARSDAEWERALAESARVLRIGGRLLVATFAPASVFDDRPFVKVEGTRRVHRHAARSDKCLVEPAGLDADMAAVGLEPEVPTELVTRTTDNGQRVTVNAFYVKSGGQSG